MVECTAIRVRKWFPLGCLYFLSLCEGDRACVLDCARGRDHARAGHDLHVHGCAMMAQAALFTGENFLRMARATVRGAFAGGPVPVRGPGESGARLRGREKSPKVSI